MSSPAARQANEHANDSIVAWWRHRWAHTPPLGRVSVVGFVASLLCCLLFAAVWAVDEQERAALTRDATHAVSMARLLLDAQRHVQTERRLARALAHELWASANASERSYAAPPTARTVAAVAAENAFRAQFAATDAALAGVRNYAADDVDFFARVTMIDRAAPPLDEQWSISFVRRVDPNDIPVGARLTRDAALTRDVDRRNDFVDRTASEPQLQRLARNVLGFDLDRRTALGRPEQHIFSVRQFRDLVSPVLVVSPAQVVRGYYELENGMLRLAVAAAAFAPGSFAAAALVPTYAMAAANLTVGLHADAQQLVDATARTRLGDRVYTTLAVDYSAKLAVLRWILRDVFPALLSADEVQQYVLHSGLVERIDVFDEIDRTVRARIIVPPLNAFAQSQYQRSATAQAQALEQALRAHRVRELGAVTASRGMPFFIAAAVICAVCLALAVQQQRNMGALMRTQLRDESVAAVLRYVQKTLGCLRVFDLQGATVATTSPSEDEGAQQQAHDCIALVAVHHRIQRCVASLRYIATTLNPLLFPERSAAAANYYSSVRKQGTQASSTMTQTLAGVSQGKEPVALLDADTVELEPTDDGIADRVEPRCEKRFGVFITLDVGGLVDYTTSTEQMDVAAAFVPRIVNLVEEVVVLHGGVPLSLLGHHVIGSWNVAEDFDTTNCSAVEAAAHAAFTLAAKLNILRRRDERLSGCLMTHIGLTAGDVRYGVFADQGLTMAHVVGPALARLADVASANAPHLTTIAVDDTVARALQGLMPCKPIEILAGGERVHELLPQHRHHEADLHARLAEYRAAFDMFERGYHAEALKGFRKYTKAYGYDGSVERIQGLITS